MNKENWYKEDELISWLKKNKYSDKIARELAPVLSKNFNLAFRKGMSKSLQERIIKIDDNLPEINQEVLLFVLEKNGAVRRTLGFRSNDRKDPECNHGWVMDFHMDGNVIAYFVLPELT